MKKCAAAILLMTIGAALAVGVQKPDDGIKYVSPEERYKVSFPAEPKVSSQVNTNSEGLKFTQYLASASDENSFYMVGYFDLEAGVTYSLDKARDGMLKAVNGTLVSEMPITLDGTLGRELLASVTDSNGVDYLVTARLYNVNMRVYVVQFLRAKSSDDKVAAKAARFFDSFQLVKS